MQITRDHPASSYGQPVILDSSGNLLEYAPGVKAIRAELGITARELAEHCGVSKRTVEGWEYAPSGAYPQASALNVMNDLLMANAKSI